MAKIFLFIFCLFLSYLNNAESATLDCKYDYYEYKGVGNIYYCWVQNTLNIVSPETARIDSEKGSHGSGKDNNALKGIWSDKGGINYFPLGLQVIYPNIIYIYIKEGRLKEIHQSDLKQYPNLVVLDIWNNDIEVLEDGLFDYTPDLVYISLHSNKICYIGPNNFDHLTKLRWLQFNKNECIDKAADDSPTAMTELIKTIKNNVCVCPGYVNQKLQFEIVLLEFNLLGYEALKKKLEALETEFKISKFANFNFFQNKLQYLKGTLEKRYQQILLVSTSGIDQYGTCSTLKSRLIQSAVNMKDLVTQGSLGVNTFLTTCNPLFDGKLGVIADNLGKAVDALGFEN